MSHLVAPRANLNGVMLRLFRIDRRLQQLLSPKWLLFLAAMVLVVALMGFAYTAGRTTAQEKKDSTNSTTSTLIGRGDFATGNFTIRPANGEPRQFCALVADNDESRARGLMGRDSLDGADAMLFTFTEDTNAAFYMANVRFPLSIAFFDANGKFVSATDMELCTSGANSCPRYRAARAYRYALETSKNGLIGLGVGAGSQLMVGTQGTCG